MNASKAMDWIRLLFAQIDKVVYWLISVTYSIINKLSDISIFGSEDIQEFAGRIYAFLGVIMLFKVTFSLITYLIDPEAISDKTKGTGNLIKNIIITLFLIIIVPYGFDLLYRAQSSIINDNLIPKLILGTEDTETTNLQINMDKDVCGDDYTVVESYGDYLATVTLRPFLKINKNDKNSKEELISALNQRFPDAKDDYCIKSVSAKFSSAVMYADTADMNNGQYIFDYSFFVSTAFGILIFLLLLNFCFDIAVRTIKLGFLEIIAPIPIISYIDPKSGKDGIFKKWFKEVINTWLGLFIRLAAIYFAIYIITIVNTNVEAIHDENGNIIMLFLIIGALMFAKQAIPLIENIFGIKFNHTVQLNPFKKISDQALGGKQVVGLGAAGAGLVVGGLAQAGANVAAFARNKNNLQRAFDKEKDPDKKKKLQGRIDNMNWKRGFSTTLGGLGRGAVSGMQSGYKSGSSGKMNVFKNVNDDLKGGNRKRNNRENINNYNRELYHKYQEDLKFDRTGMSAKEIQEKEQQLKQSYEEQKYGFMERNILEKIDQVAGVKNEYGGYGYYNKQIEDLTRKIDDNNVKEQSLSNAYAQYCVNNNIDQLVMEDLHKAIKEMGGDISKAIAKIAPKSGYDDATLTKMYQQVENQLKNIDQVNAETKQMKKERKEFKEMLDARENAKKDK